MPSYVYKCKNCEYTFTEFYSIDNRDSPCSETCSKCGVHGHIKRVMTPVTFNADHFDAFKQAGNGWKEVQDKIIAGCARNHTIKTK